MRYVMNGDAASISRLAGLFAEVCTDKGVMVGKIKATLILMEVLDRAQKEGLFGRIEEEPADRDSDSLRRSG